MQYKKSLINLFSLYRMKKKLNKREEKNLKRKRYKIKNILKEKRLCSETQSPCRATRATPNNY
jgi:hypothetical protein